MLRKWLYGIEIGYDYVVVGVHRDMFALVTGDVIRFLYDENDMLLVEKKDDGCGEEGGYRILHRMKSMNFLSMFCLPFLNRSSKAAYAVARIEDGPAVISGVPLEDIYI